LRCCVDFSFGNYFPCSSFKGYYPQISVDVLTFLIDSTFHPVGKRSMPWLCIAVLTICSATIFHAQVRVWEWKGAKYIQPFLVHRQMKQQPLVEF
jgi:hypothetical protein